MVLDIAIQSSQVQKENTSFSFAFPILLRIYHGYRPSQIAEQLGISPQLINYYTDNLIDFEAN